MINTIGATGHEDPFTEHRRLLFGIAYRMLGSVADAEDVLQDAWLKWAGVDQAGVEHPRAYLVRTVSNLSINRLTSARATRETYIGPWLPEPLLSSSDIGPGTSPDVAERAELDDSVSMAVLVVLESLSPLERAVFVLREAFGYSHAEIAQALDRSEASVRQTAHRAQEHVRARRPRYDADEDARRRITEKFLAACTGGDLNAVMELLAPDVTSWSDGGGKVRAARRALHGPDHVGRWILGVLAKPDFEGITMRLARFNGQEGVLFYSGDQPVGTLTVDVSEGRLLHLRTQINPDKLRGVAPDAPGSD